MQDRLGIFLQTLIDKEKEKQRINKQIASLSNKLTPIKIKLKVDKDSTTKLLKDVRALKKDIESISSLVEKNSSKKNDKEILSYNKLKNQLIEINRLKLEFAKIKDPSAVEKDVYEQRLAFLKNEFNKNYKKAIEGEVLNKQQLLELSQLQLKNERDIAKAKKQQADADAREQKKLEKELYRQQASLSFERQKLREFYKLEGFLRRNSRAAKLLADDVDRIRLSLEKVKTPAELDRYKKEFAEFRHLVDAAGASGKTFGNTLSNVIKKFGTWFTAARATMFIINMFRQMVSNVRELDAAMTELKKVTDETNSSYDRFLSSALTKSKQVGSTVKDYVNATADFARLGYNIADASTLAETAIVYKNVGDGIEDISEASESIISTMKAFGIEAQNAMSIVDKFNAVGNQFASSSGAIGVGLMKAASSLATAGNTIDQSIGLFIAMNEIIQNEEVTGTALKTIAMRLRNTAGELEEMGEDAEGAAESVTKLQQQIKQLSGVDIMLDADTFKSTYQIMVELSRVWDSLSDRQKADITHLVAGIRQGNTFNAMMTNMASGIKATEAALDSQGSALEENAKYLDSIAGRMSKLQSSFEALSYHVIDSDTFKGLIDAATTFVNLLDGIVQNVGVIPTVISSISAALSLMNKEASILNPFKFIKDPETNEWVLNFGRSVRKAQQELKLLSATDADAWVTRFNKETKNGTQNVQEFMESCDDESFRYYIETYEGGAATVNGYTKSVKAANAAMKQSGAAAKAAAVGMRILQAAMNTLITLAISWAIQKIIEGIGHLINAKKEAIEKANELTEAYKDASETINKNIATLENLREEFEKLSQGVDEHGKNIGLTSDEYQRYQEIVDQIISISPNVVKAYDAEGKAIYNNNTLLQDAIDLQKELNRLKLQEYLASGDDVFSGAKGEIEEAQRELTNLRLSTIDSFRTSMLIYLSKLKAKQDAIKSILGDEFDIEWLSDTNNQIKFINNLDKIIIKLKQQGLMSDEYAESLKNQLGLIELQENAVDAAYQKIAAFLKLWASDQDGWYDKIPTQYLDEYALTLQRIAKDSELSLDQMKVQAMNLGKNLVNIKDSLPTDEIEELNTQLRDGAISSEEYNEKLAEYIEDIEELASKSDPLLGELLRSIADGYRDFAKTSKNAGKKAEDLSRKLSDVIDDEEFEKKVKKWLDVLNDWRRDINSPEYAGALEDLSKATGLNTDLITENLDLITAYVNGNEQAFEDALDAKLKFFGIQVDNSTVIGKLQEIINKANEGAEAALAFASVLVALGQATTKYDPTTGKFFYVLNQGALSGLGGKRKKGGGGGGGSKKDKVIAEFDKQREELEHLRKMDLISEAKYYERLMALADKYYKGKSKYLKEYREIEEEYYQWRKDHSLDTIDTKIAYNTSIRDTFDEGSKLWEEYNQKIYNLQLQKQQELTRQIQQLIKNGFSAESDEIIELQSQWYEIEQWKRDEAKRTAELRISTLEDEISLYETMRDVVEEGSARWKYLTDQIVAKSKELQEEVLKQILETIKQGEKASKETLNELYELWYELEQRRREEQIRTLELQQENYEKAHNAIIRRLDKEIDRLKEQKELLSDESIEGSYGYRIKAIQDEIDLLNQRNEEDKLAIDLEKARQELEEKRRQKNKYIYRQGQGFVYEADLEAIEQAEQKLADLELQKTIKDLEAQKKELEEALKAEEKAIDDEIKNLEQYKDAWDEIIDSYENAQEDLMAAQLLGADWEEQILNRRLDVLENFKDKYIQIQKDIAAITAEPIPTLEELAYVPATPSTPPSSGGGQTTSPSTPAQPQYTTYTVKKGDTLSKIAKTHNTTVDKIMAANADLIKNKNKINVGWVLKIPKYASGRLPTGNNEFAIINERGEEIILRRPTAGQYQFLSGGDTVFPADISKNLWEWGKISPLSSLAKMLISGIVGKDGVGVKNDIHVDQLVFPNVTDKEEIKQAILELPSYFAQQAAKIK